jgi:4-amino-4-deoxy-L-arabinose transferase-like glycosyltransferase
VKITPKFWSHWKRSPAIPLLLILAINIAWFFLFVKVGTIVGAETGTDGYKEIAENLVRGNGFIFSRDMRSTIELGYMKREPIYPYLLSVILRLTGTLSSPVLCLFQTSLSLISCWLIYCLGKEIFGSSTGILASFIYALHPISFWYSTQFASEIVAVPVILLCLLLTERFFAEPTRMKAAQVGLSIGIATLTKSACVMLLPVILFFPVLKFRTQRQHLLSYMFIIVFFYASVHSLWILRNYSISGEIVPFTTNSGGIFFYGNEVVERFDVKKQIAEIGEADNAAQALYRSVQDEIAARTPHMSLPWLEAQTNQQLIAMARRLVLEKPFFVVRKFLSGMCFIWFLSSTTAKSWGWMMFQMPLLALAVLGLCRQPQWGFSQRFLLCVVVAYIVPYTLLLALARYSMPIIPVVILFASYGVVSLLKLNANRADVMLGEKEHANYRMGLGICWHSLCRMSGTVRT